MGRVWAWCAAAVVATWLLGGIPSFRSPVGEVAPRVEGSAWILPPGVENSPLRPGQWRLYAFLSPG